MIACISVVILQIHDSGIHTYTYVYTIRGQRYYMYNYILISVPRWITGACMNWFQWIPYLSNRRHNCVVINNSNYRSMHVQLCYYLRYKYRLDPLQFDEKIETKTIFKQPKNCASYLCCRRFAHQTNRRSCVQCMYVHVLQICMSTVSDDGAPNLVNL